MYDYDTFTNIIAIQIQGQSRKITENL